MGSPGASIRFDGLGVNVAGYLNSEKGLGEAARSDLRDLDAARIPYVLSNYEDPGADNVERVGRGFSSSNPYDVNLVHVNFDHAPDFVAARPEYMRGRYNIASWAWELSVFPEEWHDRLQPFDEVWVPSRFVLDSISRASRVPVVRVPHSINPAPVADPAWSRADIGVAEDAFLFLFSFDFQSVVERKNPHGAVRAFERAFGERDDVVLVLKSSRGHTCPRALSELRSECDRANVRLVDGTWSRPAITSLFASCDGYVSLHRSEGFGLTLSEAMALGKPVIATGYSGNLDFMTPGNSFLVDYRMAEIPEDHGLYRRGLAWAEPDIDHAARLMRTVYENRDAARARGERARRDVLAQLHPSVVGERVRRRLSQVQAKREEATGLLRCSRMLRHTWRMLGG